MESELVPQVGTMNAQVILDHCSSQPPEIIHRIGTIISQLPDVLECNLEDVPALLTALLALTPSTQDSDGACTILQEIELNLARCPNARHAELYVYPVWIEVQRCVMQYLIADLCRIVMQYVETYSQRFYHGLIVKTYTRDEQWYVGQITCIATVATIPFVFIEYYGQQFACSDWFPATSSNLKCFYNSRGERIEKAKFLSAKEAETYDEIELFNGFSGEYESYNRLSRALPFFGAADAASVRTFMV